MPGNTLKPSQSFRPAKMVGGNEVAFTFLEAASQSFKEGAVLVWSSGKVAEGGTDPSSIVGVAAHEASGVTDSAVMVYPALPNVVYRGVLTTASTAHTLAQANLGAVFGIAKGTDGAWFVDQSDTAAANVRVRIVGFVDPVGTSDGEVLFTFLTYTQSGSGATTPVCALISHQA